MLRKWDVVITFFFFFLFNFFLAVLGLCFCARAFSSCGEQGPLFIAVRGPLTVVASLVAEHRLQMRRLSSCGSRAQLLRGMWDLPRSGLEPVSPALAGRFLTTAPPGKPLAALLTVKLSLHKNAPIYGKQFVGQITSLCKNAKCCVVTAKKLQPAANSMNNNLVI